MCFNFCNNGPTKRTSKWARFDVEPESVEQLKTHSRGKLHTLAVAWHFKCDVQEVVVEKTKGRAVLAGQIAFARGRPQPEDYMRVMSVC